MTSRVAIYARTSPDCLLSIEDQVERLSSIASEHGWLVEGVFTDRPLAVRKGLDRRPGEMALIDAIRSGTIDKVLVSSIDRIGKSLVDLVGFLDTCRLYGVSLYVEEQELDTAASNGMSLFDLAGMMALHLRQSRRDRILRGQAAARALSIRFGRPPIPLARQEKARRELIAGKGVREAARSAGISAASASRLKNAMSVAAPVSI
jgi:DNA invertase Pin-like site-specific DNA recombinase